MPHIYHITTQFDWQSQKDGATFTAPSLDSDGFIHASMIDQIVDTANAIFAGYDDLVIQVIDTAKLVAEVKIEDTYGHGSFPHIYGPIETQSVIRAIDLPPNADGTFALPDAIQMVNG